MPHSASAQEPESGEVYEHLPEEGTELDHEGNPMLATDRDLIHSYSTALASLDLGGGLLVVAQIPQDGGGPRRRVATVVEPLDCWRQGLLGQVLERVEVLVVTVMGERGEVPE
jgi:hypothetical protein